MKQPKQIPFPSKSICFGIKVLYFGAPEALQYNRAKVIDFYNLRRRELLEKEPNAGHYAIAELEKWFDVEVITQNVDNFHERAGSGSIYRWWHLLLWKATDSPYKCRR